MEQGNGSIININVNTSSIDEVIHEAELLKQKIQELNAITVETPVPEKVCATCRYYIQHYKIDRIYAQGMRTLGEFSPVNCGHCVKPRIKFRKPDGKACNYWEEK